MNVIGIMSGTSVDAIDAVLLNLENQNQPDLIATRSEAFPEPLRETILQLRVPGENEIDLGGRAHTELGERYARIAHGLIKQSGNIKVSVIGCHGQTVRHRPGGKHPFTLQLGSGAVIAQRTGIPVVTDFRSADLALGGQGAPLAPVFHRAIFSSRKKNRAIINLGGIANITILPANTSLPVTGFDTGPANGLMDAWIHQHKGLPFDQDGHWAMAGKLDIELLEMMLSDPYFNLQPPKSSGQEYFNIAWIQACIEKYGRELAAEDVQQTLAWLTARSITNQLDPSIDEIFLCGGGVNNAHLVSLIAQCCQQPVATTDQLGFPPAWIEASAFAWMAHAAWHRTPATLPSVTGASRSTITGAIYYP